VTDASRKTIPYWRLSGFYLFYFAVLGALLPYWSLYLQSLGFSSHKIGELMALLMATRILAPNIWGYIADYSGRRMTIIRLASLLAALAFQHRILKSQLPSFGWDDDNIQSLLERDFTSI
jgi:PPP family 3-phenylpropionic acid transporter